MPAQTWPSLGTTIAWSLDGTAYTTVGQVLSISKPGGGEVGERDTTNLASAAKTRAPTIPDHGEVTFELNWDPTDAAHQQIQTWTITPPTTIPFWKVTFATTATHTAVFNAFVKTLDGPNAGGVDDNLTASVTLAVSGGVTIV